MQQDDKQPSSSSSSSGVSVDNFTLTAPELIKDLATTSSHVLVTVYNIDEDTAVKMSIDMAMEFAKQCGGTQVYVPTSACTLISSRDYEIYQKFNGHNHNALAKEYGISYQWVYNIIKRVRKQIQDKEQPSLF